MVDDARWRKLVAFSFADYNRRRCHCHRHCRHFNSKRQIISQTNSFRVIFHSYDNFLTEENWRWRWKADKLVFVVLSAFEIDFLVLVSGDGRSGTMSRCLLPWCRPSNTNFHFLIPAEIHSEHHLRGTFIVAGGSNH